MISSTGTSLQTLVVERGGDLRITAPLRLNNMSVAYGGVLENDMQETGIHCFNFLIWKMEVVIFIILQVICLVLRVRLNLNQIKHFSTW